MRTITKTGGVPMRDLLFGRLVLIYQMPKIGSQTIESTLQHCSFPTHVLRFHYLSAAFARMLRHGLTSPRPNAGWRRDVEAQLDFLQRTSRAIRYRRVLRLFGWGIPKLEVITGMRELIGLMLASIFENYSYFAPNIESMSTDRCREALLNPKTFKILNHWFELELAAFTRINVFDREFPHQAGHAIYENHFARVLVYRFESLKDLPAILTEFLNWPIPSFVNRNLGESKQYADQYQGVKNALQLPADFVRSLYQNRMMLHFYTDSEREAFYRRWVEQGAVSAPAQV
jgi:hypothetical protein